MFYVKRNRCFIALVFLVALFQGCAQSPSEDSQETNSLQPSFNETASLDNEKPFQTFYVYLDRGSRENHYIPSGFMPDGKCLQLDDRWKENCHAGETCMKIVYDIACSEQNQRWAGIYWLNPANNWGQRKGGFNLTGASKLTFWAKGEKGGERIEEFKIGGIFGDYPDSDMVSIGPVILTNEWKEYIIDLRDKDLSYISGGFSWATNVDANPESCIFYLDEIKYE